MRNQDREIKPSRKVFTANYPHFRYWKKSVIDDMLAEEPLNIYIHIPFCLQKCAYCYYKTDILKNRSELEVFVNALCREIKIVNERFHLKKRPVKTIYIGGGTPSLLTLDMLKRIGETLNENFNIDVKNLEFTIEAEPRTISAKKVKSYKESGINRISIGVQSFSDEIIKLSGRNHTGENALKAIDTAKNADPMIVNIDLLSGLAGETNETWGKTVDTAIKTNIHSITVYKLEVHLNTEFFSKSVRKKVVQLPSESQELHFMKLAIEKFEASNYKPWSFFTFTRDGKFNHHYAANLWRDEDCCAFGPSAYGKLGNYHYQNSAILESYLALVKDKKPPVIRAYKLTGKDLMIKDVLLGMKLHSFDRTHFIRKHGFDFCNVIRDTVENLHSQGYILLDDTTITLTSRGLLYGDYVGKKLAFSLKKYLGLDELSLY